MQHSIEVELARQIHGSAECTHGLRPYLRLWSWYQGDGSRRRRRWAAVADCFGSTHTIALWKVELEAKASAVVRRTFDPEPRAEEAKERRKLPGQQQPWRVDCQLQKGFNESRETFRRRLHDPTKAHRWKRKVPEPSPSAWNG